MQGNCNKGNKKLILPKIYHTQAGFNLPFAEGAEFTEWKIDAFTNQATPAGLLCAIKLIRKFFTTKELIQIATATVFSILYYNSESWHMQSLKQSIKQKIMSSSAGVLKACMKFNLRMISFERIHTMNNIATPKQILLYKNSLALFRLYYLNVPTLEWCA